MAVFRRLAQQTFESTRDLCDCFTGIEVRTVFEAALEAAVVFAYEPGEIEERAAAPDPRARFTRGIVQHDRDLEDR